MNDTDVDHGLVARNQLLQSRRNIEQTRLIFCFCHQPTDWKIRRHAEEISKQTQVIILMTTSKVLPESADSTESSPKTFKTGGGYLK